MDQTLYLNNNTLEVERGCWSGGGGHTAPPHTAPPLSPIDDVPDYVVIDGLCRKSDYFNKLLTIDGSTCELDTTSIHEMCSETGWENRRKVRSVCGLVK